MTIQPYDMQAVASPYERVHVEHDSMVPPEVVAESKGGTESGQGDQLFISPAAQIYARFVRSVSNVLEEFVDKS